MLIVKDYDLKDSVLISDQSFTYKFMIWVPDKTALIIGRGNNPENALIVENIAFDGLPVYRRPSGGEAVLVSENTLIISIADNHPEQLKSQEYFRRYNEAIINSLATLGVSGMSMEGISDVTIGGKKILGCSIYRNKRQVFYHAVLNVSETPEKIARYLSYPKKTPAYRAGRDHIDFITSLRAEGYDFSMNELKRSIAVEITYLLR